MRQTVPALSNLATVYSRQGSHEKALELTEQACKISQKAFGERHIDTIKVQGNLAVMLKKLGRVDEAEELYRYVLLAKREQGDASDVHRNLAILQYEKGQAAMKACDWKLGATAFAEASRNFSAANGGVDDDYATKCRQAAAHCAAKAV